MDLQDLQQLGYGNMQDVDSEEDIINEKENLALANFFKRRQEEEKGTTPLIDQKYIDLIHEKNMGMSDLPF